MKRIILALAFAVVALCGTTQTVSAQEILLEGPLAGAPAVRKLVQYRELRFSAGPQFAYTVLNDYMHNFMLGARLEFNIFEWLGVGLVGYYSFNLPTKLTDHVSDSTDIGGNDTTPSESNYPSYTGAANFAEQVARLKGLYVLQASLIPLRGKLAMFEKLFSGNDLLGLPVLGMVFFLAMFVGVVVWVFGRKRKPHYDRMSRLPLSDD